MLSAHYDRLECEGGYEARCKMWLPDRMEGAWVLDVGCRRGKGVYRISERIGASGFVMGVDWRKRFLEEAQRGAAAALARSGLHSSNMAFRRAYPENLQAAGVCDGTFDLVVANSVLNVAYDRRRAYAEIARVLKPGGVFVHATVVTKRSSERRNEPDASPLDVFAAAVTERELANDLRHAGFDRVDVQESEPAGTVPSHIRAIVAEASVRP